jgi:hypothetical protein
MSSKINLDIYSFDEKINRFKLDYSGFDEEI